MDITKLKAYWKNRKPQLGICNVMTLDFRTGKAEISNTNFKTGWV